MRYNIAPSVVYFYPATKIDSPLYPTEELDRLIAPFIMESISVDFEVVLDDYGFFYSNPDFEINECTKFIDILNEVLGSFKESVIQKMTDKGMTELYTDEIFIDAENRKIIVNIKTKFE